MKILLLVVLGLVVCCYSYYCNADLLEEGTTQSGEIVTKVEHKSTGNVVHNNGNQNTDVGGIGSAKTWSNCPIENLGTGACSEITSGTLTTYQEYIALNSFEIKSGGQIDWSVSTYLNENDTMYFESRLYNDNSLLQTDIVNFTDQLAVKIQQGTISFDNAIDKAFISIGGVDANASTTYGGFFDDLTYNITYNYISTSIQNFIEIVQPTIAINEYQSIDTYDVYNVDVTNNFTTDIPTEVFVEPPMDMMAVQEVFDLPEIQTFEPIEDTIIDMPVQQMEVMQPDTVEQIKEIVADIEEADAPLEIVVETPKEEIKTPVSKSVEPIEEVKSETPAKEVVVNSETKNKPKSNKPTKQEKANRIMQTFNNIYSAEAQSTQIFLIMALGTNYKSFEQTHYVPQIDFYKEQIITNTVIVDDFYGDYFSVGNSLMFNNMVDAQFE